VRDERCADIHEALVSLAASLILFNYLQPASSLHLDVEEPLKEAAGCGPNRLLRR
jgi:hypothetical protein